MHIVSLDIATTTGIAWGDVGEVPRSRAARVRGRDQEVWWTGINLVYLLQDHFKANPMADLIVFEAPLNPYVHFERARKSGHPQNMASVTMPWASTGALMLYCDSNDIPVEMVNRQDVLRFFTGKRTFGKGVNTKEVVLKQCHLEGLLPAGCRDYDRADAIAQWKWAEHRYKQPAELKLFAT